MATRARGGQRRIESLQAPGVETVPRSECVEAGGIGMIPIAGQAFVPRHPTPGAAEREDPWTS